MENRVIWCVLRILFCVICWPYRVSELTNEFKCVLLSVNSHPMCSHFTEYY